MIPTHRSSPSSKPCCSRTERSWNETVPIVATLLSIPLGDRYAPLELTPEQLKEQTLHLLIRRVRDISLQKPVLCLVEDAHWIDPTTSELLSRMIPALKTSRMFLIVTSRKPTENFQPAARDAVGAPAARPARPPAGGGASAAQCGRPADVAQGECRDHRARRRHSAVCRGIEQGRDGVRPARTATALRCTARRRRAWFRRPCTTR